MGNKKAEVVVADTGSVIWGGIELQTHTRQFYEWYMDTNLLPLKEQSVILHAMWRGWSGDSK